MGHTKEEIRDRLQTDSIWITPTRTALFAAVPEARIRYVIAIWIKGNRQNIDDISFEKLEEDDTYTMKFSPIPVAPADFRQIPEGSYDLEDPILVLEGGTSLYAQVVGLSLNVTVNYWDNEI